jgi:tRNA-dihydrouridine synthase B
MAPTLPVQAAIGGVKIEPNLVLSPMEGVTDLSFRRLIRQIGGVGLTVTEFVPGAALGRGDRRFMDMVKLDPDERPVAIQLYGRDPVQLAEGARIVQDLGADICDINMGCPSKKVCKNSGGSSLMREPAHAQEIVRQVVAAVQIPVTVKMRSGFDAESRNAPELARICEGEGAQAITVHWRTRADRYGGRRAVDKIAETVAAVGVPVFANGDVVDVPSARAMLTDTGAAGLYIGRGAIADPWVFARIAAWQRGEPAPVVDRAAKHRVMLDYVESLRRLPSIRPGKEDRFVLGRLKQMAKTFCRRQLEDGAVLQRQILHSQTLPEALAAIEAWFAAS